MKTKLYIYIIIILGNLSILSAQTFEVDGINYNITASNEVEVISKPEYYSGDVVIPATVEDSGVIYNVVAIGFEAFGGCYYLTSVSLPESITEIKDYAFRDCSNVLSINVPDSVEAIGEAAFLYCRVLASINIPDNVTEIKKSTFSQCYELASINIPASVTSIAAYAFSSCNSLNTVNINVGTPLSISYVVFFNLDLSQMSLNVPIGSKSAYEATSIWQDFGTINATLNTDSFEVNLGLKAFPNPAINSLSVTGLISEEGYTIYNVSGKQVLSGVVSNNSPISVENFEEGMYFLKIKNKKAMKFIKK